MSVPSKGNNSLMIAEMSDKTEVQISFCFNTQYLAHNLYATRRVRRGRRWMIIFNSFFATHPLNSIFSHIATLTWKARPGDPRKRQPRS